MTTLTARTTAELRRMIRHGELHPGAALPAEQVLADRFQVSRCIVRNALATLEQEGRLVKLPGVGRLVAAARQADPASALIQDAVALIGHRRDDAPPAGYIEGVSWSAMQALQGRGEVVVAVDLTALDGTAGERLLASPPKGAIVSPGVDLQPEAHARLQALAASGTKLVVASDEAPWAAFDRVVGDHAADAAAVVEFLVARGRRRIGLLALHGYTRSWFEDRHAGYRRAMQAAGLEPLPPIPYPVIVPRLEDDQDNLHLRSRMSAGVLAEHLQPVQRVDALIALSDGDVFPLAAGCRLLGREPGVDLDLVGWDAYWHQAGERRWSADAPVATVDKGNPAIGRRMVEILFDRLEDRLPAEPLREVCPGRLVST